METDEEGRYRFDTIHFLDDPYLTPEEREGSPPGGYQPPADYERVPFAPAVLPLR